MGNLAYKRPQFAAWLLRRGDKKIMGLYLQVSKSLELAGIKPARDLETCKKRQMLSPGTQLSTGHSGQGSAGSGRVAGLATSSVRQSLQH